MRTDYDRRAKARALIPNGSSPAQTIFRDAASLAYAQGLTIENAVEFGTEQARKTDAAFTPEYDVALLALDSA
jgi:hypothetical protein